MAGIPIESLASSWRTPTLDQRRKNSHQTDLDRQAPEGELFTHRLHARRSDGHRVSGALGNDLQALIESGGQLCDTAAGYLAARLQWILESAVQLWRSAIISGRR